MTDVLLQILLETWEILTEASIFLLVGYLIAGALAVLVPKGLFTRLLGTGKVRSVLWASVIGIPLPLCSCGVVPTAIGLRRQGATSGATVAFLVATPETGIDSISLTYALTDPILTVIRPLAGIFTAIAAGFAANFLGLKRSQQVIEPSHEPAQPLADGCPPVCCDDWHTHGRGHLIATEFATGGEWTAAGVRDKAIRVYRYAFRDLLDDTSYWLALGSFSRASSPRPCRPASSRIT
ncbi:MAG: permease [Rhodopila sp.]